LGGLKASHLSLPLLESGYAYGSEAVQFEVGAHGAPVLAGRLRLNDSVRRMGLGAKGGPFLNLMLLKLGVSFRASADHLIASTTSGGASDWVQGLLCLDLGWFATCADGFAARFAETSDSAKQTMGYGGLSFGFNLVKFGEQFTRGMR
ncbi:MAG TPA: hypothetical protein VFQ35_15065, partial [Polyangiaceae bacterium]|nr:hypothetical protein [Polyangiaceae bacterium]